MFNHIAYLQSRGSLGYPRVLPGCPHKHIQLKALCTVIIQNSWLLYTIKCIPFLCSKDVFTKIFNFQIRIAELTAELNEVKLQRDTLDEKFLSLLAVNEKLENKVSWIDCMRDDIIKVKQEASKWKSMLSSQGAELSKLKEKTEVLSRENDDLKEKVEAQKAEVSVWTYTRQLIIIAGGEPELCCVISMLSERMGSMHVRMHYVCKSLIQNAVCTCCALCRKV